MEQKPRNMFGGLVNRVNKAMQIRNFITGNVDKHPKDIAKLVIEKFGVSRVTAVKHLQDLMQEGTLEAEGKTKDRSYKLKALVNETFAIKTAGLQEDVVWRERVKPLLKDVKDNVLLICAHGFTEILNNAIDHSQSSDVVINVEQNAMRIKLLIIDYGIGIFTNIKQKCGLDDIHHAILELAKGKLTTEPTKHSGEGIFFTSRMFDCFVIFADNIRFARKSEADWLFDKNVGDSEDKGTAVTMEIAMNATQTAKEVMDTYRAEFDAYGFSKTHIPLRLMECEGEKLISRSQAKRLLKRADKFKEVVLDFNGITEIGQAFADEIFRVYRKANPQVHLYPINMEQPVLEMINRALKADSQNEEPLFSQQSNTEDSM
jgi:anti-sigma regulatory factor (Ser/Thr protein kinase)